MSRRNRKKRFIIHFPGLDIDSGKNELNLARDNYDDKYENQFLTQN